MYLSKADNRDKLVLALGYTSPISKVIKEKKLNVVKEIYLMSR